MGNKCCKPCNRTAYENEYPSQLEFDNLGLESEERNEPSRRRQRNQENIEARFLPQTLVTFDNLGLESEGNEPSFRTRDMNQSERRRERNQEDIEARFVTQFPADHNLPITNDDLQFAFQGVSFFLEIFPSYKDSRMNVSNTNNVAGGDANSLITVNESETKTLLEMLGNSHEIMSNLFILCVNCIDLKLERNDLFHNNKTKWEKILLDKREFPFITYYSSEEAMKMWYSRNIKISWYTSEDGRNFQYRDLEQISEITMQIQLKKALQKLESILTFCMGNTKQAFKEFLINLYQETMLIMVALLQQDFEKLAILRPELNVSETTVYRGEEMKPDDLVALREKLSNKDYNIKLFQSDYASTSRRKSIASDFTGNKKNNNNNMIIHELHLIGFSEEKKKKFESLFPTCRVVDHALDIDQFSQFGEAEVLLWNPTVLNLDMKTEDNNNRIISVCNSSTLICCNGEMPTKAVEYFQCLQHLCLCEGAVGRLNSSIEKTKIQDKIENMRESLTAIEQEMNSSFCVIEQEMNSSSCVIL